MVWDIDGVWVVVVWLGVVVVGEFDDVVVDVCWLICDYVCEVLLVIGE